METWCWEVCNSSTMHFHCWQLQVVPVSSGAFNQAPWALQVRCRPAEAELVGKPGGTPGTASSAPAAQGPARKQTLRRLPMVMLHVQRLWLALRRSAQVAECAHAAAAEQTPSLPFHLTKQRDSYRRCNGGSCCAGSLHCSSCHPGMPAPLPPRPLPAKQVQFQSCTSHKWART